jgi:hypothetical protein
MLSGGRAASRDTALDKSPLLGVYWERIGIVAGRCLREANIGRCPGHRLSHLCTAHEEEGKAMTASIGVRREDKSEWERRVPVTPQDAVELERESGVQVIVQPSSLRAFSDEEFAQAGVTVQEDL